MTTTAVDLVWPFIASQESGVLDLDPDDHGNWTGGEVGVGVLKGSKWGVSAGSYPSLDIANLTYEDAENICRTDYAGKMMTERLPVPIGVLLIDAAWGSGVNAAVRLLQQSLGSSYKGAVDGELGPMTVAAVSSFLTQPAIYHLPTTLDVLLSEFAGERILYESNAGTWAKYKGGWVRRMTRCLCIARSVA
jgi:lysozyme family protein